MENKILRVDEIIDSESIKLKRMFESIEISKKLTNNSDNTRILTKQCKISFDNYKKLYTRFWKEIWRFNNTFDGFNMHDFWHSELEEIFDDCVKSRPHKYIIIADGNICIINNTGNWLLCIKVTNSIKTYTFHYIHEPLMDHTHGWFGTKSWKFSYPEPTNKIS